MHFNGGIGHAIDFDRVAFVHTRHIARRALKLRLDVSDLNLATNINSHMALIEHTVDRRG